LTNGVLEARRSKNYVQSHRYAIIYVAEYSSGQIRDNTQGIHLFRIAQEALANAIKHGRAKTVVIALETGEGACSLRISDDGIGFAPNGSEKTGMGLSVMRYRARMIGGTVEIQMNAPTGTVVACTIGNRVRAEQMFSPSCKSSIATAPKYL
jgi:signal transduction histidine kinase